jgi:hypothetical protein
VGGGNSYVVLLKKSLVKEEMWDTAMSWYNNKSSWRQSSWRSLRKLSHSHRKKSR